MYAADGVKVLLPMPAEVKRIGKLGVKTFVGDLAEESNQKRDLWQKQDSIRHDPKAVAKALMEVMSVR
jgi:hypothetical protein